MTRRASAPQQRCVRRGPVRRGGISLVEVVISIVVVGLLVGASTAAVHLMTNSGAAYERGAQDRAALSAIMSRLRQELTSATAVTELTATSIAFSTPDVAGSGSNTLRYALSGTQLTRQLNASAAVVLVDVCDEFKFTADVDATTAPPGLVDSAEFVLVEHQTYPLSPITVMEASVTSASLFAQTFTPSDASASSFKVKHVKVTARKAISTATGNMLVQVRPTKSGTDDPSSTVIDTATVAISGMSTTSGSVADAVFTSPTALSIGTEYAVVFSSDLASTSTNLRMTYDVITVLPPADGTAYRRSTDGGATWTPAGGTSLNDVRFQLFGVYQVADSSAPRIIQTGWLKSVGVHLVANVNGTHVPLDSGAVCWNRPNMAGFNCNTLPLIKQPP